MGKDGDPIWGGVLIIIVFGLYTATVIGMTYQYTWMHYVEKNTVCAPGEAKVWSRNKLYCIKEVSSG